MQAMPSNVVVYVLMMYMRTPLFFRPSVFMSCLSAIHISLRQNYDCGQATSSGYALMLKI